MPDSYYRNFIIGNLVSLITRSTAASRTRTSSGDEIANVNFFYDDTVHEFGEITHNKGHYAAQGHRLPILLPIESSYASAS